MADGFIVRRGGKAEEVLRTANPDITFVSKTFNEIVVTFKNNDANEADVFYGLTSPLTDKVTLATNTTSSSITFSGLDDDTQYTIFAYAIVTDATLKKIKSEVVSTQITTDTAPVWFGDRAVFADFFSTGMDFVTISTTGNATSFGSSTAQLQLFASCSNGSRGLFGGGFTGSADVKRIDLITIGTAGNASFFGDLVNNRRELSACSNGTRGIFAGDASSSTEIDFVTIATTGNATFFGNLTEGRAGTAAVGNSTRGVIGGTRGTNKNVIDFVTIATAGNATSFGALSVERGDYGSASNETRGLFAGGLSPSTVYRNTIDFITIATASNATNFGDLTIARRFVGGAANGTRAVFGGGASPGSTDRIDFVEIGTTGNATTFGNLTSAQGTAACSGN
jgi:hypothetical protein